MANQIKWQDKISFGVGDTLKVSLAVKEGEKTRIQIFQGIVIAIRGTGAGKNFIVRKIATGGVGVEKILPINTPTITGIEIVKKGKVRRAKLYYLRDLLGKKATKIKDVFVKKGQKAETEVPSEGIIEKTEDDEKAEKVRPETVKVKNAPKVEVVKVKKVKKGPKKIVRKEKVFVR
ncbi:MAG: 50S ribosomal protein L19 [Candidatus Collierbacteria bacterium GW2011_GWC2_44_18]|uniref:Large ribosomal subunit protein bL19 n=2 Tax=Microgenomates group TaxID=1794810 RepID=A0A0G1LF83_9BACT|nr:MAG: 50S ribosomal protein L19, large subunit ribosomal protein L19 [Microgenomates group bacterium GW2011_GWC1_44_10]KKT49173.1 MAG: 50S ribosomal protein L19 [Candidatus Collierbacteria bacterium GW2011_GWC2_44_18]KKT67342.1 MAG: 50S ribosomal protein L19 [Candidatus Woesebacteria bacterium GW2011_GWA2_44_33]